MAEFLIRMFETGVKPKIVLISIGQFKKETLKKIIQPGQKGVD